MSDPNQDFAEAAVAAMQQEQGAPSAGAGGQEEPAETDPILEYANKLKEIGIPPEAARDFSQKIAYMQTPQGQNQYFESFMATDQGAALRERFGREQIAKMLVDDKQALINVIRQFGHDVPERQDIEDDLSPEQKEIRAMKSQQAALEARIKQIDSGAGKKIQELEGKLQGREENETKVAEAIAWAKTQQPMAREAYAAIHKRAGAMAALDGDGRYRGRDGFRRALNDAHAEISNEAQYFRPKPRPRSTTSSGGGVSGGKVEGKQSLKDLIEAMSSDFARDARDERGGE